MKKEKKQSSVTLLLDFAAAYKSSYIFAVILAVLGVAAGMLPYFAVAHIVVSLLDGVRDSRYYFVCCLAAAGGYLAKGVFANWSTSVSHKATFLCMKELRHKLVSKLSRLPMGKLIDTPSSYYKDVLVDRVESMEVPLAHLIPEMTANILVPLFMLLYLFTVDWRMALVSLITVPIGMLIMSTTLRTYKVKYAGSVEASGKMTNAIVEYIGGIEVIKAFNQSARSYGKYSDAVTNNASYFFNWMKSAQWPISAYGAISPSVLLTVLPIGFVFYMGGSLTAANFVTVIILALGVIGPLITASNFVDNLARVGTVMEQIKEIMEEPELVRPTTAVSIPDLTIQLHNVGFSYHQNAEDAVLHNVNLTIAPGTITALVGPSGSGKSTIAKLIAGFWDATNGSITFGGIDVKKIPQKQLAAQIAYVSQDNYLFDDTIRENIRMGSPSATDSEVEQAAKDAGCDAFIRGLEHGYDTCVGGAGGHLSGGERQRIAIARALLKDAPIIILDEATAYIDPENEAVIQSAVAKLVAGKTLIVIAHRLSTITDSDQIVVMREGAIHMAGTHNELLANCPLYQKMWKAHIGAKDGDVA